MKNYLSIRPTQHTSLWPISSLLWSLVSLFPFPVSPPSRSAPTRPAPGLRQGSLSGTAPTLGPASRAGADVRVHVDGRVDVRPVGVVQLDAVGVVVVPQLLDGAVGELADVGLDLVPDGEAQLVGHEAGLEEALEPFVVEILADEDEDVLALGPGQRKGGRRRGT